jgi:hypothetical protein
MEGGAAETDPLTGPRLAYVKFRGPKARSVPLDVRTDFGRAGEISRALRRRWRRSAQGHRRRGATRGEHGCHRGQGPRPRTIGSFCRQPGPRGAGRMPAGKNNRAPARRRETLRVAGRSLRDDAGTFSRPARHPESRLTAIVPKNSNFVRAITRRSGSRDFASDDGFVSITTSVKLSGRPAPCGAACRVIRRGGKGSALLA